MLERIVLISERCRACRRCEVACIAAHHGLDIKEATKRRAEFISRVRVIKGEGFKTTTRCHECRNAPCCHICPTGALEQLESGEVRMHEELCIACEMCADACPYGAIQMDVTSLPVVKMEDNPDDDELLQPRKVAVRCDLCRDWRKLNGKSMTRNNALPREASEKACGSQTSPSGQGSGNGKTGNCGGKAGRNLCSIRSGNS